MSLLEISICQQKYALDLLRDTSFLITNLAPTLIVKTPKIFKDSCFNFVEYVSYRQLMKDYFI